MRCKSAKKFISKYTTVSNKKRTRKNKNEDELPEKESRRNFTIFYYLRSNEQNKNNVCKTFFLNTLSISAPVVKTVINKTGSTGAVAAVRRGRALKNSAIDESIKQTVRDHINALKKYPVTIAENKLLENIYVRHYH